MSINEGNILHEQLTQAYTEANLNKISRNLIRLYSEKQFEQLKKIASMIAPWVTIDIDEDKKGFSRLIMLYHPDRIQYYQNELRDFLTSKNLSRLERLEHILVLLDFEEIVCLLDNYQDIDYCVEYQWDADTTGFSYFSDSEPPKYSKQKIKASKYCYSFYDAVKIRNYGNITTEIPIWYFKDWDEIELMDSEIDDLDGIQYCINAVTVDLSMNSITDISPIFDLREIQELNLSDNKIGYIDALSNLLKLKSVDLSNNEIDDISPLFNLPELEYCDVSGNRLSHAQVIELEELGVSVCYD